MANLLKFNKKAGNMFQIQSTFSGFSVDDITRAKQFYGEILGLKLEDKVGGTSIVLPDGAIAWMYQKNDHQPADYTVLNFVVDNINEAVNDLSNKGVNFEHYNVPYQDEKGVMRGKENNMGPNIAWLKDPAGNTLAIIEN